VTLAFTQPSVGRRVKGRCVAQTPHNRHGRSCSRTLNRGTVTFSGHSGADRIAFQGVISAARKLRPGSYTASLLATNSAGQRSQAVRLSFTIAR
jgi:hypothetical protein